MVLSPINSVGLNFRDPTNPIEASYRTEDSDLDMLLKANPMANKIVRKKRKMPVFEYDVSLDD